MERRLAAVLVADVVGYSSLMEASDVRTLESWNDRKSTVFKPIIAAHNGRIVNSPGDNVLVEFASAVNAVAGALEIQKRMVEANHDLPDARKIVVRIGINLGDVIGEGPEIHGEAVNIAARLEPLAEPGGICVSGKVHEEIREKLECVFDDMGLQVLKNISRPIGVYRVRVGKPATAISQVHPTSRSSVEPVIVVLPFENKSRDPNQQYLSDGITEDIIIELSRYHSLQVIARNSSFEFRGRPVDTVRAKLGVKYVVEGDIRKSGNNIRITAGLVDTETRGQVWAERYDREVQDELAFAAQDELVQIIAATLEGRVAASGAKWAGRKPPQNWSAYDCFLRGRECVNRYDVKSAKLLFQSAIEKDPGYAQAYAWQALVYIIGDYFAKGEQATLDEASRLADDAYRLDPSDACSYRALGVVAMIDKKLDAAKEHFETAAKLNPTDSFTICLHGLCLAHMGRGDDALLRVREGLHLDRFPAPYYWEFLGVALFQKRQYAEATDAFGKMKELPWYCHCYLAACCAHQGKPEARDHAAQVLSLLPHFSVTDIRRTEPFNQAADIQHLEDGLRKAGLPVRFRSTRVGIWIEQQCFKLSGLLRWLRGTLS